MEHFNSNGIPMVHEHIINMVTENLRFDFYEEGVGEDVLQKLRAIWTRKIFEKNVTPVKPPAAHSSPSSKGNTCKKRSNRPKRQKHSAASQPQRIKLREDIQVGNAICNRSMPLLSSDEDDETKPLLDNNMVERIPEVNEQQILVEQTLPSEPELTQKEIIMNKEHGLNMKQVPIETNNNVVQKRGRGRPRKTAIRKQALIETNNNVVQKRGRGRSGKTIITKQAPIETNNNVVQKRGRGRPRKTVITKQALKETNNYTVQKRGRGRPRKYPPVTKPRPRGRPMLLKNLLKMNGVKQNQQSTSTCAQECEKNCYQHYSIMQTDGASDNPKFNVKPKFTGIPVKANKERLDETELDTDDDITDNEDLSQTFECDNVIICQCEKVKRIKNKWKINLKHGVMHFKGKDYVFNTANCKVEW